MIYLIIHLAIGAALMGTVLIQLYLERRRSKSAHDFAAAIADTHDERSLIVRSWEYIFRPLLGGILIVIGWPLVLIYVAIEHFLPSPKKKTSEPVKFAVSGDDLNEKLSIAEIEEREVILDPLNAEPNHPFGHLHSTWVTFLNSIEPDSELWSFNATWDGDWRGPQKMAGYVAVLGDHPGPHFITMQETLADKDDSQYGRE